MLLYPQESAQRRQTLLRDLVALALLVAVALLGLKVHGAVDRLAVLGEGVSGAGGAVQGGFDRAADAAESLPFAGDDVAEGLRAAGEGTGGAVVEQGRDGEHAAHRLALVLGLVTFGVPAAFLLLAYLPPRLEQVRRLTDARQAIGATTTEEERRLLAMRAAFSLPYGTLLRHTDDPLGDLAAGRHDALVAAALEDAGLRETSIS